MGGAGLPFRAIAQQKQGRAAFGSAQAQAPAGCEIEWLGVAADIGDDSGDRPASQGFFGDPKEVPHVADPHDHQLCRIEAKR